MSNEKEVTKEETKKETKEEAKKESQKNKTLYIQNQSKKIFSLKSLKNLPQDPNVTLPPGQFINVSQFGYDTEEKVEANNELTFGIASGDLKIIDSPPKLTPKIIEDFKKAEKIDEKLKVVEQLENPHFAAITLIKRYQDKYSKDPKVQHNGEEIDIVELCKDKLREIGV